MSGKEFDKVFLQIEGIINEDGNLFGKEWDEVRRRQIGFLLERPLLFKVITEKVWGPARLDSLWTTEWKETERAFWEPRRADQIAELGDMGLLLLTLDCLSPDLVLPSQKELARLVKNGPLAEHCKDLGMEIKDLVPNMLEKIDLNKLRNPVEAYGLVAGEEMEQSILRLDHNWGMLKKCRDKIPKRRKKRDWWRRWLTIDDNGWLQEIKRNT